MVSHIAINRKIIYMLISILMAFSFIVLRLMYLQIHCEDYFVLRSQKNFTRYTPVLSARGNICDVHGNLLATNRPMTTIYWQGTGNSAFSYDQLTLLQALQDIIDIPLT